MTFHIICPNCERRINPADACCAFCCMPLAPTPARRASSSGQAPSERLACRQDEARHEPERRGGANVHYLPFVGGRLGMAE